MNANRLSAVLIGVGLLAPAALGQNGAIVLYENGSPDMGLSYAGAGARAQDAGTVFSNPAGMSRLEGNQLILGVMAIFSDIELELNDGTVSVPPGSTNGGGNIGTFAPGLGSFLAMELNEQFHIGFTVTALAANGVDYNTNWVGRAFVTKNQIVVANFMPTVSFRFNEWLSLGAGLNIAYMLLDQEFLASNALGAPTIKIDDADDWQLGGTFGALFELSERTRLGLTYRTEIEFDLSGDIQSSLPGTLNFDSQMPLAQGINLSAYHELNDQLALLGDVGWSDWSTFDRLPTTIGPVSIDQNRDWDDTWRIGIGAQWRLHEDWMLRGGFGYDSSPVDDDKRLPDIPVGEQFRFSIGLQHDFGEGKVFSISYTGLYSPMDVDGVALPPAGDVVLSGEYDPSFISIIGFQLSLQF